MARNYNNNSNQVAVLEPPRMQMPERVTEQYGLNEDSWRALTDAVFPLAKTVGAVMLALAYCDRHKLDVFQKVVHIVPMKVNGRTVETVWPGIGQLRVIAQRQDSFAGYDECVFGDDVTETYNGKKSKWESGNRVGYQDVQETITAPEWAQFIVYKMMHGQRVRLPGPKVYFEETFASKSEIGDPVPNDRWARAPRQMLEKCAEAAAYRRAFPDVLGNEMSAEEMEGRDLSGHNGGPTLEGEYVEVTEQQQTAKKAAPKRSDFKNADQAKAADDKAEDQQQAEPEEGKKQEAHPLDQPGIPNSPGQWDQFLTMFGDRLRTFTTRDEVDAEQERQQFRIDAANFATRAKIFELIAEIAEPLPAADPDTTDAGEASDQQEKNDG